MSYLSTCPPTDFKANFGPSTARVPQAERQCFVRFRRLNGWGVWMVWASIFLSPIPVNAKKPEQLAKLAKIAETKGQFATAYALYAQAAAEDPTYWVRAKALERRALESSPQTFRARFDLPNNASPNEPAPESGDWPMAVSMLPPTAEERQEVRQLASPPALKSSGVRKSFQFADNTRYIFEQLGKAYGVQILFDEELRVDKRIKFAMDDVDLAEALRITMAATKTIALTLDEKAVFIAEDTPQKRQTHESHVAISVPIPDATSVQEATEIATALRAVFNLQRMHVDANNRQVFLRDAISKVRPAVNQLHLLMRPKPEVVLEIEFLDISGSATSSYGFSAQNRFNFLNLGGLWNSAVSLPTNLASAALGFGGGQSLIGLGIASAELIARASQQRNRILIKTELRATNMTAASLNIGERYPIVTSFSAQTNGDGTLFPPQVQFQNLGFNLKVTPRIHGADSSTAEVTLDVEAEYTTLSGQSFSGFPAISQKKFQSQVRLAAGAWGMIGGLVGVRETRGLAGLAGLGGIPMLGALFAPRSNEKTDNNVLILIKPTIVSQPENPLAGKEIFIGPEQRPMIPL
jgi:general secretion pathway protein D